MRNGPNPVLAPKGMYHWFDGDGMVHAVYFRDGSASYIRRWVRTTRCTKNSLAACDAVRHHGSIRSLRGHADSRATNPDYCKDTSNTTLTWHNGRVLSQWYNAGHTYALDPLTLDTVADETFGNAVDRTMNAHSKRDPRTGELIDYDYGDFRSDLTYYVVGADGHVKHKTQVELPGPRLPHDTTIRRTTRSCTTSRSITMSVRYVARAIASWSSTVTSHRVSASSHGTARRIR